MQSFWHFAGKTVCAEFVDGGFSFSVPGLTNLINSKTKPDIFLKLNDIPDFYNPDRYGGVKYKGSSKTGKIKLEHEGFSGFLQRKNNGFTGEFKIRSNEPSCFYILLRTLTALLCEKDAQIFLHASAVLINKKAWIFCGPSGSGKSTIATSLNNNGKLFSMDRVIINTNFKEKPTVFGTPFSMEEIYINSNARKIAGIAFIEQSTTNEIGKCSPLFAVRKILSENLYYSKDVVTNEKILEAVTLIAGLGICYNLKFAKDISLWDILP